MGDITREKVRGYRARRKRAQRYTAAFLAFATLVGCGVGWSLRQTGISATAEAFCGAEEHTHTQECYEKVLICGLEEGETLPTEAPHEHTDSCCEEKLVAACAQEEHTHTDGCYAMQRNLTCTAQEHSHTDACYTLTGGSLVCAAQEHTHSDECKDAEGNIVCGLSEHTHGDGCYSPVEKVLSCTLQEHTHGDSCFGPAQKTLICGHAEHTHTAECMKNEKVLVCTLPTQQEPQEPHVHTDACYEEKLICGKTEHTHSELCFSNTAARETEEQWAAAAGNPGSGIWAIDLLGVASSQLGYEEVKENFILDENGAKKFYTRYGDSYGDPYGSWNGMFLAYCLKYAGVPEVVVPRRAGVAALLADMASSAHLKNPGEYYPQPGDIAVFGDRVGVIDEPGDPLTVICGNVDGKVAEIQVAAASVSKYIQVAVAAASMSKCIRVAVGQKNKVATYDQDSASSFPEGSFELKDKITSGSMELKKKQGNDWIPATNENVKDGDEIQLSFQYTVEKAHIRKHATYQLPEAFKITNVKTGKIYDLHNKEVGEYQIDTNGLVTLTYEDTKILDQESFEGTFGCSGSADRSKAGDDGSVSFPGGLNVKINPKTSSEESWSISKGHGDAQAGENGKLYVKYNVIVKAGSDAPTETVSIVDKLNSGSGNQIKGSYAESKGITLVKHNADGTNQTVELTDANYKLENTGDTPTLSITNLPALANGEYYQLNYWVEVPPSSFTDVPNGEGSLNNSAEGKIGDQIKLTTDRIDYGKRIKKTGNYDSDTGTVKWTIELINIGNKMDGSVLKDLLPDGVSIVGNPKLYWNYYGSGGNYIGEITPEQLKDGYTFPAGSDKNWYSVELETTLPASGSLINKAQLTPPDSTKSFETSAEVTQTQDKWSHSKKLLGEDGSLIRWSLDAVNTTGAKKFEVTDRIINAKSDDGVTAPNTHYAIASELDSQLRAMTIVWVDTNGNQVTPQNSTIEIHYYGAAQVDGTPQEIPATDAQKPVQSFTITVTSGDENIFVKSVKVSNYTTHWSSEVEDGKNWVYRNEATIEETTVGDGLPYRKAVDFEKLVSIDGKNYSQDAAKDLDNNKLQYQIILKIPADYDGSIITVEDVLPDGAVYQDGSAVLARDNDFHGTLTVTKTDTGIEFKISDYQGNQKEHIVSLRYSVSIADDPYWKDLSVEHNSKHYVNSAKWKELEKVASADVAVTRKGADDIYKDVQQESSTDANGKTTYSNVLHYTVTINPQKKQLGPYPEYLEIQDQLYPENGASAEGDLSSVRLYYYHVVNGELSLDRPVPTGLYQILDSEGENWLRMRIPNSEAFVLCYDCIIDPGNKASVAMNNWAEIKSVGGKSRWFSVQQNADYATVSYGQLQINKVDSFSGTALPGAEFQIQKYNKDTQSWEAAQEISPDKSGAKFNLTVGESENATLKPETLYRVVETRAPKNYRLEKVPYYVIFYTERRDEQGNIIQSADGAFKRATGSDSVTYDTNETITQDRVTISRSTGMIQLTIKNTMDKLMVHKNWLDKDNNICQAPVKEIQIQLYRYTDNIQNAQPVTDQLVKLNVANKWEYAWSVGGADGLPEFDENGKPYLYYVQEVGTSNIWQVTYGNNRGITSGIITVTNKVTVDYTYELPRTGGSGTKNFVLFGAFAMILAGCGMIVTRKKHYTGVYER